MACSPVTRLRVIDSHTAGEPTRLILSGFPDLGNNSMALRQRRLATEFDHWRRAVMLEPRGHDVLVGALLCKPQSPGASAGVIFFNNSGYLGMCGHGTIGLVTSLAWQGTLGAGRHLIETPAGNVNATLNSDGSVTVENVSARRYHHQIGVEVPGYGTVHGDVAWGGNWFFLCGEDEHGLPLERQYLPQLIAFCQAVRQALAEKGIRGKNGAPVDHIELFCADPRADSRNFVLCPGDAWDRSPCGTGTSAKVACLAEDGLLAEGAIWRQASIIGSEFTASWHQQDNQLIPSIRGCAWVTADSELIINPQDPFAWGLA